MDEIDEKDILEEDADEETQPAEQDYDSDAIENNQDDDEELDDDDEELDDDEVEEHENEPKFNEQNQEKNIQQLEVNYSIYDYNLDEDGDDFLEKFDEDIKKNFILEKHKECLNKNFEEIKELLKIKKNKDNIIIDELHKTLPILTKYEKTKILGIRLKQLNSGAQPYINVSEKSLDNYYIANKELIQKKIPFIIERPLPNGNFEYWKLKDLEII